LVMSHILLKVSSGFHAKSVRFGGNQTKETTDGKDGIISKVGTSKK